MQVWVCGGGVGVWDGKRGCEGVRGEEGLCGVESGGGAVCMGVHVRSSVQLRAHVGALLNGHGAVVEGGVPSVQLYSCDSAPMLYCPGLGAPRPLGGYRPGVRWQELSLWGTNQYTPDPASLPSLFCCLADQQVRLFRRGCYAGGAPGQGGQPGGGCALEVPQLFRGGRC